VWRAYYEKRQIFIFDIFEESGGVGEQGRPLPVLFVRAKVASGRLQNVIFPIRLCIRRAECLPLLILTSNFSSETNLKPSFV
jgi:hypothetical protein